MTVKYSILITIILGLLHCGPKVTIKKVPEYPFNSRFIAAVLDFENGSGDPAYDQVARGIGDEMVAELLKYQRLRLVERAKLAGVLNELSLEMTGLVDSKNAQKVGSLLGVDALLYGQLKSVTHTTNKNSAGLAYNMTRKTEVVLSARLIMVQTGEILASATAPFEITQSKNVALFVARTGNMTNEATAAHQALGKAVQQLANDIAAQVPQK